MKQLPKRAARDWATDAANTQGIHLQERRAGWRREAAHEWRQERQMRHAASAGIGLAPGQPIRLTLYSEPGAVASAEPNPIRSGLLASKLIEAAGSRLSR